MAGMGKNGPPGSCDEELHDYGASWYFSRKEIEDYSPSRRDGIDLKKETYLRKSYSTFTQDLGMRLQVPQVTIATAIVLCHRFFHRQSHAKNDRKTIATVCMFLAGKVEETPRPLKDVIHVSYEIIHKKGPSVKMNKEVYEQQKELILLGEKLVLATLGFDLNVHHPYRSLVDAIKKFKVAKNALAKVAWNFVNDGLRTSLSLQFKPQQMAAGAIFLAAKFIKVKLPSDGDKAWWQEFNVTPRQLEDVSNQLLELYEQNHTTQPYNGHEVGGSSFARTNHHPTGTNTSTVSESSASVNNPWQRVPAPPIKPIRIQQQTTQCHNNGHVSSADSKSGIWNYNADCDVKDGSYHEPELVSRRLESGAEGLNTSKCDGRTAAEVISAVRKTPRFQNDAAVEVEGGIELEKRKGWPKPLNQLEKYPFSAARRRKPAEFVNGNAYEQCREEDGELSSIIEHNYSSQKLQSYNPEVSGAAKRKPDELWSDHPGRDHRRARLFKSVPKN